MDEMAIMVRYSRIFAERKMKKYNLGFPEQMVLMHLVKYGQSNQEMIAKQHMIDKGTIAKTVNKLVEKGLISKSPNPENKRENMLEMMVSGEKMIQSMQDVLFEWNEKLYEGITEEERELLIRLHSQMTKNAIHAVEDYAKS